MGKQAQVKAQRRQKLQEAQELGRIVHRAAFYDTVNQVYPNEPALTECEAIIYWHNQTDFFGGERTWVAIDRLGELAVLPKPPFDHFWIETIVPMPLGLPFPETHLGAIIEKVQLGDDNEQRYMLAIRAANGAFIKSKGEWRINIEKIRVVLEFIGDNLSGVVVIDDDENEVVPSESNSMAIQLSFWASEVALQTISMMNCKNIVMVDNPPASSDNEIFQKYYKQPLTTYKTLAIKSEHKRYDSNTEQQRFDVMPLHLRRGHYKHYTEEAPRFGVNRPSNVGTFWYPTIAVGNDENGIVAKDYKVQA